MPGHTFLILQTSVTEFFRAHLHSLSPLTRFAIALVTVFVVLPICRRFKVSSVVGLLLAGILLGPYVLDIFGKERPIADFFADLGKLLLMFYAGLDIDLGLFRQARRKTTTFGLLTT